MIKAIIVDDESKGRETLAQLLTDYCPSVEVINKANNVTTAYAAIIEQRPDLVFLDVEMPGGNGFDLLERFDDINFEVIFTTAYGHYAIKAIQYSALDYLLKPIAIADLKAAVKKVEKKRGTAQHYAGQLKALLQNVKAATSLEKIAVPDIKGLTFLNKSEIIRCESQQNYTLLYLTDNRKILSTKPIKEYEDLLKSDTFFRVHNSHLVNLNHVTRYERGDGGTLIMTDNAAIEVSRRRKSSLLERIG